MYLCGNGGSAANALHLANDWLAAGVRVQPLVADVATLTMLANDYGYEHIFSRQLRVLGQRGDVLVVLSGSGNSPNIKQVLACAIELGIESWAIVGGGEAAIMANHVILTPGDMQACEEEQLRIGHTVADHLKVGLTSLRG